MNYQEPRYIKMEILPSSKVEITAKRIHLPELIHCCFLAIEANAKKSLEVAETNSPELVQDIRQDIYDMVNFGASTLLARMFPEIEMRPELTVEAIKRAEEEILAKDPDTVKRILDAKGIKPNTSPGAVKKNAKKNKKS